MATNSKGLGGRRWHRTRAGVEVVELALLAVLAAVLLQVCFLILKSLHSFLQISQVHSYIGLIKSATLPSEPFNE